MAPQFYIFEGIHNIKRVVEIEGKAHISTDKGTFRIREKICSNTFLLGPDYLPIPHLYEGVPVDLSQIVKGIPEDPLHSPTFCDLSSILSERETEEIILKYCLLKENIVGQSVGRAARICTEDIIRVLCYMQALSSPDEFTIYNENVKEWAYSNFRGISVEIGLFVLIRTIEASSSTNFMLEWRMKDLYEPDLDGLLLYMKESAIAKMHECEINKVFFKLNIASPFK
ncbi:hypothetical protein PAEPH01_0663 [Pancytospora epiphaga]|nr:hypothetical protein PAEPH01_0663 [Pancytospora epiphaga]